MKGALPFCCEVLATGRLWGLLADVSALLTCYAMLGCIVGALVWRGHQRMHGACVDNSAPTLLYHERERCFCAVERGGEADCYDGIPFVLREGMYRRHILDAHIVHQNVQSA